MIGMLANTVSSVGSHGNGGDTPSSAFVNSYAAGSSSTSDLAKSGLLDRDNTFAHETDALDDAELGGQESPHERGILWSAITGISGLVQSGLASILAPTEQDRSVGAVLGSPVSFHGTSLINAHLAKRSVTGSALSKTRNYNDGSAQGLLWDSLITAGEAGGYRTSLWLGSDKKSIVVCVVQLSSNEERTFILESVGELNKQSVTLSMPSSFEGESNKRFFQVYFPENDIYGYKRFSFANIFAAESRAVIGNDRSARIALPEVAHVAQSALPCSASRQQIPSQNSREVCTYQGSAVGPIISGRTLHVSALKRSYEVEDFGSMEEMVKYTIAIDRKRSGRRDTRVSLNLPRDFPPALPPYRVPYHQPFMSLEYLGRNNYSVVLSMKNDPTKLSQRSKKQYICRLHDRAPYYSSCRDYSVNGFYQILGFLPMKDEHGRVILLGMSESLASSRYVGIIYRDLTPEKAQSLRVVIYDRTNSRNVYNVASCTLGEDIASCKVVLHGDVICVNKDGRNAELVSFVLPNGANGISLGSGELLCAFRALDPRQVVSGNIFEALAPKQTTTEEASTTTTPTTTTEAASTTTTPKPTTTASTTTTTPKPTTTASTTTTPTTTTEEASTTTTPTTTTEEASTTTPEASAVTLNVEGSFNRESDSLHGFVAKSTDSRAEAEKDQYALLDAFALQADEAGSPEQSGVEGSKTGSHSSTDLSDGSQRLSADSRRIQGNLPGDSVGEDGKRVGDSDGATALAAAKASANEQPAAELGGHGHNQGGHNTTTVRLAQVDDSLQSSSNTSVAETLADSANSTGSVGTTRPSVAHTVSLDPSTSSTSPTSTRSVGTTRPSVANTASLDPSTSSTSPNCTSNGNSTDIVVRDGGFFTQFFLYLFLSVGIIGGIALSGLGYAISKTCNRRGNRRQVTTAIRMEEGLSTHSPDVSAPCLTRRQMLLASHSDGDGHATESDEREGSSHLLRIVAHGSHDHLDVAFSNTPGGCRTSRTDIARDADAGADVRSSGSGGTSGASSEERSDGRPPSSDAEAAVLATALSPPTGGAGSTVPHGSNDHLDVAFANTPGGHSHSRADIARDADAGADVRSSGSEGTSEASSEEHSDGRPSSFDAAATFLVAALSPPPGVSVSLVSALSLVPAGSAESASAAADSVVEFEIELPRRRSEVLQPRSDGSTQPQLVPADLPATVIIRPVDGDGRRLAAYEIAFSSSEGPQR